MKTLKEELQEIVDRKKITPEKAFICNHLNFQNEILFHNYKGMAKKYATQYFSGAYSWWRNSDDEFVISEKYRFIKDLIAII